MGDEPGPQPRYRQHVDEPTAAASPVDHPAVAGTGPELTAALVTAVTGRADDVARAAGLVAAVALDR